MMRRKARLEIVPTRNGQFIYRLRGANGEIMLSSEPRTRRNGARQAAQRVNDIFWNGSIAIVYRARRSR